MANSSAMMLLITSPRFLMFLSGKRQAQLLLHPPELKEVHWSKIR
jgi:hypothetical protein